MNSAEHFLFVSQNVLEFGNQVITEFLGRTNYAELQDSVGPVDIVIGGPPCQGFSNANRQHTSVISMKNRLVKEYVRAIVQKSTEASQDRDDFTLWQVDISQEDYDALIEKYQNDGYSVRGNRDQIIEEFIEVI